MGTGRLLAEFLAKRLRSRAKDSTFQPTAFSSGLLVFLADDCVLKMLSSAYILQATETI